MFGVVYTPTEGDAIKNYSKIFRRPEGLFLNIRDVGGMVEDMLLWGEEEDVDYIVVTGTPWHCNLIFSLVESPCGSGVVSSVG